MNRVFQEALVLSCHPARLKPSETAKPSLF